MIRRSIAIFFALLMLLSLAGCGASPKETKGMHIICTVFPQYDWVRNILGEELENNTLTLLMDNGADLHNYQATAEDMMDISECDLFIYVGGESDQWVEDALKNPTNPNRKTIMLLETDPLENTHIEGAQGHDHDHEHDQEHEDAKMHKLDEHIWLSLQRAERICQKIAATLGKLDPENKELYSKNAADYGKKLLDLDKEYQTAVQKAPHRALLVADRFPFRYMAEDHGLDYYAAFSGCSTETQASFETIVHLTEKLDALKLPFVIVTESSDQSVANSIIQNSKDSDRSVLVLDSMQSVSLKKINEGSTYLSIMESNLSTLKKALGVSK